MTKILPNKPLSFFKIASSNPRKIAQYQKFGLPLEGVEQKDLPEPQGDILTIARYKSQNFGPYTICEDSALFVENHDIGVNIKHLQTTLNKCCSEKATIEIALALNDGEHIFIVHAEQKGEIVACSNPKAWGFNGFFKPEGENQTLDELLKNPDYKPLREQVIRKLKNQDYTKIYNATGFHYNGPYQQEN